MTSPVKKTLPEKSEICVQIGASLKKIRIQVEKSQEELAFDVGLDRTYISQIERGLGNPSILTLADLCRGLNITLLQLLDGVTIPVNADSKPRRANQAKPLQKLKSPRLR